MFGSLTIRNVHLPNISDTTQADALFDVYCEDGKIKDIKIVQRCLVEKPFWHPSRLEWSQSLKFPAEIDAEGEGILLPSLCHSHVHLDRCFLLDQCPNLNVPTVDEAFDITEAAKSRFINQQDDVYERGKRLVRESIECGVTAMRAFVDVDAVVHLRCLKVAIRLKDEFKDACDIQIAVVAQHALFDSEDSTQPGITYDLLKDAAALPEVSVVGSVPGVESSPDLVVENIRLVLKLAIDRQLHADFHLDYDADSIREVHIHDVIHEMRIRMWTAQFPSGCRRGVTISHGTLYSHFTAEEWRDLKAEIGTLPIYIAVLPQSDVYTTGSHAGRTLLAPSILPVPFISESKFNVSLGVDNIGNAFTPQGNVDPLSLCSFGVAIYGDASFETCQTLLNCVSTGSKYYIGHPESKMPPFPGFRVGDMADFVLMEDNKSVRSVVLSPCYSRTVIRGGKVVAFRRSKRSMFPEAVTHRLARMSIASLLVMVACLLLILIVKSLARDLTHSIHSTLLSEGNRTTEA